jgi:hypothetical protein
MNIFQRRIKGGLVVTAILCGVFLWASAAVADGAVAGANLRGVGNCPPQAPCITELLTEAIVPYNQPLLYGTTVAGTRTVHITVDRVLHTTVSVEEGLFEVQLPWGLKTGEHFVYVRDVIDGAPAGPISNVVNFFVTKPEHEPQISATRIEGVGDEDAAVAGATSTSGGEADVSDTAPDARDEVVGSENIAADEETDEWPWAVVLFYAAIFAGVVWMLVTQRGKK